MIKFKNDAETVTSLDVVSSNATISVGNGNLLPEITNENDWFPITLINGDLIERLKVVGREGGSLSVVRGQEGTIARNWPSGTTCIHGITASAIEEIQKDKFTVNTAIQMQSGIYDYSEGDVISTLGRVEKGDLGGATYFVSSTTMADGYVNLLLDNGLVAELLLPDEVLYMECFGCVNGEDVYANLQAAFAYQKPIKSKSKRARYYLSDVIYIIDKSIDFDLNGSVLIPNAMDTERALLFINNFGETKSVNDVTYSGGRTRFTVDTGHGISALDKIKSFSNQNINPFSAFPNQRVGEYFVVESVTDTSVICIGRHIWDYAPSDNPRLAKMSSNTCHLKNINIERELAHSNGQFAVAIDIQGYYSPTTENIYSPSYTGQLLSVRSCYRATLINTKADYLLDDTSNNAVGYVGVDYGSQESKWYGLHGGKVRHTYTTGADSISADTDNARQYGGAIRCHVYTGVSVGNTNFAYDTHQDAWECEFHDITVYDDYSTTYASTGGFQDRGQNNIVHKLTYISDGADVSAGSRAVMYNTGARNTYIKEIIFKGTGTVISSYGLADSFTDYKQNFRVDKITTFQEKYPNKIVSLSEPISLNIGEVHVYPEDATRSFYGSGGGAYLVISDENAHLTIGEFNLWWNSANLASITKTGDYLLRLDGDCGRVRINVHTHTNANTYQKFESSLSGVRVTEENTAYHMEDSVIHWTAHVDEWDDAMRRDATLYGEGEVTGQLKYTYRVLADGVHKPDSSKNSTRAMYEAGHLLQAYAREHYGLVTTEGVAIDEVLNITVAGQGSAAAISEFTAPAFIGQRMVLTNLPWNGTGVYSSITINSGATNTDCNVDTVIALGRQLNLIAYENNDSLVWSVLS